MTQLPNNGQMVIFLRLNIWLDAVVLNDKVYVIAGETASGVYSNKVFAADLNTSMEGVYDLYRKDGDARWVHLSYSQNMPMDW